MKLFSTAVSFVLISITLFSQKEANVWHFGFGYGLDFNSGEAVQITGAMSTFEGCTAYCDSAGNLLFYSNGGGRVPASGQDPGHIWNKNHEVMYDMQGLEGGGFSAAQSSVIVPAPGEPNVYYLFTIDEIEHYVDATPEILALQPNGRGFRYFKVDMTLNNGLGDVVEADIPVYDYSQEGLCAIRHANGSDYWILINQDTTGIGVYSVTSEGVALSSVFETDTPQAGIIKASPIAGNPDAVFFAVYSKVVTSSGLILEFDLNTGELSDPEQLPFVGSEAFEFSHNSQYLYATATGPGTGTQQLVRYNLASAFELGTSIASTQEVISPEITAYYMQMAPDMKIYFTWFNFLGESKLGAINCVNNESPTVTTEAFTYSGGTDELFFSLPNFPSWTFYNPYIDFIEFGPDTVYLCAGDSIILDAGVGDYWEWGGDCFSGPESTWPDNNTRYFTVTQPGTYVACVTGPCSSESGAGGCDTSDQITVLPCTVDEPACDLLNLPDTLEVCAGDTLQLEADLSLFESYAGLQWLGGGTFIPSDTIAQPLYVPSAQEVAAGSANLTLQVFIQDIDTEGGSFLAYDHSGEDIIFYTNTVDGSVDTIQSNTGNDWTAMGFRASTNTLYGLSNIVTTPALSSVNLETGAVTPIFTYTNHQFYAGDYDNVNDRFYAIGIPETNIGEPLIQTLYSIDLNTGALDAIGEIAALTAIDNFFAAGEGGINGLAYDASNDALFATTESGELYAIDPNTAATIFIGNTVADLRGLAFDYNENELWGISTNGTLYHIDVLTGETIEEVPCQQPLSFVTTLTYALPQNVSENVCSDNTTIVIRNDNTLDLGDDATICEGETLVLSAPGFESISWQDGSTGEEYVVNESGTYSVNATDSFGCSYSDAITITVNDAPNASFTSNPQPTTIDDTEITFTSTSSTAPLIYAWEFESGTPAVSEEQNPVVTFPPIPGNYTISLIVENANGCVDTLSSFILIDSDGTVNLPNIFTPNGDGDNDRFVPFEAFPGRWQLTIFNRWGVEVFDTENLSQGWNGADSPAATYYWVLEPRDGQQGESRAGYVTLIRD
jgi:gliding motility-associated-like protein